MTMKYQHTIPIVLLLALSTALIYGCSKLAPEVKYEASERILFTPPLLQVETKNSYVNALGPGDSFGVIGYCVPNKVGTTTGELSYSDGSLPWSSKRNRCQPNVFFKQKVTIGNNGCIYDRDNSGNPENNNPKHWYRQDYDLNGQFNDDIPANAENFQYSFFGYFPYDAFTITEPAESSLTGAPKITFTMPFDSQDISTELNFTETPAPDAMLGILYNQRSSGGALQFNFYHVLSGLNFVVNNYSKYSLEVHRITLHGQFYRSVFIDFTGSTVSYKFTDGNESGTWYYGTYVIFDKDRDGGALELPAVETGGQSSSSEGLLGEEYLLLIAGIEKGGEELGDEEASYFGKNIEVTIDYTFNGQHNTENLGRPGSFSTTPGVLYTTYLNFVGDAFTLQFVTGLNNWEDGEADDGKDDNDDLLFN